MKTRDMRYRDYGFRQGEEKFLRSIARENEYEIRLVLHDAAYKANKYIAEDIVYSIVYGVSYDEISKVHYIPLKRTDFYGYCRKCLSIFRDELRNEAVI